MSNWEEIYVILAIEFDATISDRPNDMDHIRNALRAMVDLTTEDIGSLPGYGTEASTFLLPKLYGFYTKARQHYSYSPWRNIMVQNINDFTVEYFGDLTKFVNNLPWSDGCVPFYWAELTENGSHDTSGWTVCANPS